MASFGAAVIVAHMPFTATVIDPEAINPFGEKKRLSPDAQRLREWQANRRWALTFGKPKKR